MPAGSDGALALYRQAVVAHQQGRDNDAVDLIRAAIALNPDLPQADFNLGIALRNSRRFPEAVVAFQSAIAKKPDLAEAHFILGALLLSLGEFTQGWQEYGWRWQCKGFAPGSRAFSQPRWDGRDPSNQTILVHTEQGLGDTIQFIRYANLLIQRQAKVIIGCDPALQRLLRSNFSSAVILDWEQPLPRLDFQCPMLDLPRFFDTTLETIPAAVPYLTASAPDSKRWRHRLQSDANMKVGLVWAGRSSHPNDRNRSMTLDLLAPLAEVKGVSFYSLQKTDPARPASNDTPRFPLIDLTNDLKDFADTAALIANLDLIISVDTSVAHLAGAMGKPVWTLLPFVADWRWLLDRQDTPWYPSMRLFRQPSARNWTETICRVADALSQLAASRR
jgi:tetratricopeptide (TPR) repeat protein